MEIRGNGQTRIASRTSKLFLFVLALLLSLGTWTIAGAAASGGAASAAAVGAKSPSGAEDDAAQATAASMARSQAELEKLAARLPITLYTDAVFTLLTIDPYAEEDPAEVWNDWRMENKKDTDPPLLVIVAHNMWAYYHGVPPGAAAENLASQPVVPVNAPWTNSEALLSAIMGNIAPGAPVLGEDAEVFISVDPNNPLHIVGSANHRLLYDSTCTSTLSVSGVTLNSNGGQELYWSTDGGATWSHQCAPWSSGAAYTLTTSNGTSPFTFQSSDPSIAWDTSGNAYVFTLPWWQDSSGSYSGKALQVAKWTASSNTWAGLAAVPQTYMACTTTTCDGMDKTEGAIDTTSGQTYSHTDRMYFVWVRLYYSAGWNYGMRIAYSDPPYSSWTVNNFSPGGTWENGVGVTRLASSMTVGADGTVYLAWDRNLTTGSQQMISKSTDGGVTWSTAVQMSSTYTLTDFGTNTKIAAQDTRGIALLPQIAVDACATSPYKGRLYESYTDYHYGVTSGNDVDVYVNRSTDGGATWSNVHIFTGVASGTSQFEPTTTADPSTGAVTVVWYDTSVDPTNNRKTQIYSSQSTDGGTTWSAQQLVTDSGANFGHQYNYLDENSTDMPNVTTLHHYQYGEYMGAASSGGKLWLAWTDSRNWLTETPSDTEYEDVGTTYGPNIVYQSHGTITQVTGDGDAWYERGEKWSVTVTLTNTGNLTATNVTATFGGNGITVCTPTQSFGAIAPGGTASATFEFVISPTFTPCGGSVSFTVTGKTSTESTPAGADESGVFSIAVGQATAGSSTQLVIQPSAYDTYVNQNAATTNYGTATTMTTNVRTNQERDVLVQFDLSGIPAGATITSATLELYNTTAPASTYAVDVMRNTATWNETGVTWNTKPAYDATYVAQITPTTAVGWKIWTVTSAVQGWYAGTYSNYGFTVKPDATAGSSNVLYTFASRENGTSANRPILRVNYLPPVWDCSYTGSGTCCNAVTGLTNNTAADLNAYADTGVQISWSQDVANWGDAGAGTRTYDVLRGGSAIAAGLAYGTTSYTDTTGVNGTSYTYSVRYNNGCGQSAATTGVTAADNLCGSPVNCDDSNPCTVDTCDPLVAGCVHTAGAAGTLCRASAGQCDVAEYCDGVNAACPTDGFASSSTSCTGSSQGGLCDDDAADHCLGTANTCVDVYKTSATVCRASAGDCDVAETCTGTSGACPADAFQPASYQCRAAAGVCDVAEFCPGGSASCPADAKSTAVCRPSAGVCDVAESCDGVSNDCPADTFQPPSVQCRGAAGVCDVAEFCTGSAAACPADAKSTAVCRPAADVCDMAESCDGVSNDCPADAFQPASVQCRAATGACDVAEFCTGGSVSCPVDAVQPASYQCRAAAGVCDVAEFCDGAGKDCPADAKSTAACRPAADGCDVAESCDGISNDCPADAFKAPAVECRGATGVCDVAEFCTGSSASCPADAVRPTSYECRASAGVCDVAEFCDGSAKDCPADAKSTAECRPSAGVCDVAESCDGIDNDCPADAFKASTVECRGATGVCDVAEFCTGSSASCPADAVRPTSYECRASAGVCDVAEFCDGSAKDCPADAKSTAECRPSAGVCDVAESCDGINNDCPADAFKAPAVECRGATGVCDVAEFCTGSSASCPADAVRPTSYECRASAGVCDVAEFCDGATKDCPADAKSTAECRPSAGVCDVAESCDGIDNDCPADAFKASTVECRGATGVCDVAEFCTGSSASCPADAVRPTSYECRASAGVCDVAEFCDGATKDCPADAKSTAECRPSAGVCDVAESCDGINNDCPADLKSTAVCRPAAGVCDVGESCDGVSNDCPADAFKPATVECRGAAGVCDLAEFCTGSSAACSADAKSTAVCRPAAGVCDVAESCDGVSNDCPVDAYKPSTVECRAAAGVCDVEEFCTGSSASCPADAKSTAVCRPAAGVCDVAESCDGVNSNCPADTFKPNGTACDDGNVCTSPDACANGACTSGPHVPPPAAVNNSLLVYQNGSMTELTWTDAPGPFNAYRGTRVSNSMWTYNHACLAMGTPGPSVSDGGTPLSGTVFYYLITRKDACGESIPGQDSSGAPEPNPTPCQ